MIILGEKSASSEQWHSIDLAETGTFEVLLRPPTFADVVVDSELGPGFTAYRLKACVRGWRCVQDEHGREIPFTFEGFENLCLRHPRIIYQLGRPLNAFYLGMTEDSRKNSSAPPDEPSRPAAAATEPMTTESTATTSEPSPPGAESEKSCF